MSKPAPEESSPQLARFDVKQSTEQTAIPAPTIPVVGIGFSAGGFEAMQQLLAELDIETGMAFVLIPHLSPDQKSHLPEILGKDIRFPAIQEIKNGQRVEADTLYVLPPGHDVAIAGDFLNLSPRGQSDAFHLGIDYFFSSLSQSRKSRAIGILLSGTGSDGTQGLKAIKSEGGVTLVQDPRTAKFDGMPRSALASGVVDLVLSPAEIAKELLRIAKHPYTQALLPNPQEPIPPELESSGDSEKDGSLNRIIDILRFHTQVDFSKYKVNTIRRRVERQMMLRKIESIERYATYLKKNTDEVKALYEDIFIHVTDFFRDPEAFDALEKHVFPKIVENRPADLPLRIWVPGCATGEEVYSLAIALLEFLEANSLKFQPQLFGTDISEPAIQRARKGIYPDYQMRKISQDRLEKFFDRVADGYKIKKAVRDLCIFSRHDVTSNPPIPNVDLISCRNVLIYFSGDLQKRVFPVFHYALNRSGFLLLGRAENPGTFSKLFSTLDKVNKIYRRVQASIPIQSEFKATAFAGTDPIAKPAVEIASPAESTRSADQVILYRYSPPAVVTNSHWDILQFRGRTVPYLEPPAGIASYNLLKMANPEIAPALRSCLQLARKQAIQVRKESVSFKFEGRKRMVNIDVSPLNPSAHLRDRQYLVIFEESSASKVKPKPETQVRTKLTKRQRLDQLEMLSQYNTQLQQELDVSREYQQSLIEEYETAQEELTSANEELRSTNEELQSTNEELQSANEELGTSKEELQAANEELLSTNDELQKRNIDLENTLNELERSEYRFRLMIEAVRDYAIYMLDPSGRVVSWNLGAERLKGYQAKEVVGHHFSRFYTEEDIARKHPDHELEMAARDGVYEEEGWRVRKDGSRFWASVVITAIRTKEDKLIGYSKVTRDLTERKRAEEVLRKSHDELEVMVNERTAELAKMNEKLERAVKVRDEFLSLASHELKTPLTSLLMQAQTRERKLIRGSLEAFGPEQLRKLFENDKRLVNRLARLVDDMLDISRIGSNKLQLSPERFDLASLLRDAVERFGEQFSAANCEVTTDICESAVGELDRFRVEQVLVNLFSNAIKYAFGKPVHISLVTRDRRAIITVKDQGMGISKEDQARVFEQFERATEKASGLGLGLYIVKHIVENQGGTVRVESELGKGAAFIVELPILFG